MGVEIILFKYVKNMKGYDETDNTKTEELTKKADNQFTTYVYSITSDQNKYGSVIKGLSSQKALNND